MSRRPSRKLKTVRPSERPPEDVVIGGPEFVKKPAKSSSLIPAIARPAVDASGAINDSPLFDDLAASLEGVQFGEAPAANTMYVPEPPQAAPVASADEQALQELFGGEQAAAPSQVVDPEDKKVVCFALGVFRFQRWPCTELPDYRGFYTSLAYRDAAGRRLSATVTISGRDGGLVFSVPVLKLDDAKLTKLLPTINMLNRMSTGSSYVVSSGYLWVRLFALSGTDDSTQFAPETIQHSMRQVVADMRAASHLMQLCLLRPHPTADAIPADFALPRCGIFEDLTDLKGLERLARESGYATTVLDQEVYVSRAMSPDDGAVALSIVEQVLYASFRLPQEYAAEAVSNVRPELKRCMRLNGVRLTPSQQKALLLTLNELNEVSTLVRYVAFHENQLAAVASRNLRLKPFSSEDLFFTVEALFAS
ncbi:MAG TPA: hypothetical protein VEJ63_20720 [Planctomycetota bacterium]|nr:hypothetical protein [Planctomycetota bacterium]